MSTILVVNPGSASKKYALFHERKPLLQFVFERVASGYQVCTQVDKGLQQCVGIDAERYESSFTEVAKAVRKQLQTHELKLTAIAVRVVAPGKQFQTHQVIDDVFVLSLRQKEFSMPLHVPFILQELQNCKKEFGAVPQLAISDSDFHRTLPQQARNFSIDRSDAETYDIYRFGYHGLSVASVLHRIHPVTGCNPSRVVVCHVGAGVSATAVLDGKSVETTMGYTPTSGLPMGSQAGELDPGGLLELMRAKNLKPSEAEMYIHTKGGLVGLSETPDLRHILDRKARGDAVAIETLQFFVYRVQRAIAASTVALGGFDMLVLTGTACTRSSDIRCEILKGLSHLGIVVDHDRNDVLVGQDGVCSSKDSTVKVVTIRTDEMGEMAQTATRFLTNNIQSDS